jgi:hypothetical protein
MAVIKPDQMEQKTWDYLLKLTKRHEWPVLHMYNNKASPDAAQDVTCGIGFANMPTKEASLQYIDMFYDKDTDLPATREQMMADWVTASQILRTFGKSNNLESTPQGDGYADQCQLRMRPEKVYDKMAEILKARLNKSLQVSNLWNFSNYPATAQVACASFWYGFLAQCAPNMCRALAVFDFDEAGKQSYLKGISTRKLLAHRALFWNAARLNEQNLDFGWLPFQVDPPEILPWKPWTSRVLDLDSGSMSEEQHETEPARPGIPK